MKSKLLVFFILLSNLLAQNAGNTGYSFLKIGTGAAEIGLAEAVTSKFISTFSVNYNPALITQIEFSSIGFMHNEWIQDLSSDVLVGNTNVYGVPVFVLINSTKISEIEIRTRPGNAEGTFNAHYFYGGLGTGFKLFENFSVGANFKYLYENIYVDESNGYAFDFGIFKKNLIKNFDAGLSFRNFGKVNLLSSESAKLPSEVRFGLSYSGNLSMSKFNFYPSLDIQKYLDYHKLYLLFGFETIYNNLVKLRFGYNSGRELNNLSFGFGLKYRAVAFDYAFLPFKENFGNANLISIYIQL